jgi:hypothetical protein
MKEQDSLRSEEESNTLTSVYHPEQSTDTLFARIAASPTPPAKSESAIFKLRDTFSTEKAIQALLRDEINRNLNNEMQFNPVENRVNDDSCYQLYDCW